MKTISLPDDVHELQLGRMVAERRKVGGHMMWLTKARANGWHGVDALTRQKAEHGEPLQRERLEELNVVIDAFERATVAAPRGLFVVSEAIDDDDDRLTVSGSTHG